MLVIYYYSLQLQKKTNKINNKNSALPQYYYGLSGTMTNINYFQSQSHAPGDSGCGLRETSGFYTRLMEVRYSHFDNNTFIFLILLHLANDIANHSTFFTFFYFFYFFHGSFLINSYFFLPQFQVFLYAMVFLCSKFIG